MRGTGSAAGTVEPSQAAPGSAPRVWLLMGHRAGDNSQVLALAEALDWPFQIKRFVYQRFELVVNLPFTAWLAGVDKAHSTPLGPPWPDLVLSAGRRNEPIARWIQRRAGRRVRLVHVGRPWARIERFDLVVTTPQYRLPALPNVLQNETPLHRVTRERLEKEAVHWAPHLDHLPRPRIAVLVGGSSGPYPFDAASGARLARAANALAEPMGGSLLVTTSARTEPDAADALFAGLRRPAYRYRWTKGAAENPYFGILGLADRLIVTADSISMMAEACATGRPVHLFDTGEGITSMRGRRSGGADGREWLVPWSRTERRAWVYRLGMRYGPPRWTRDIRIVQRRLVDSGRAAWLGEGEPPVSPPPLRDLERAVARVRALFGSDSDPRHGGEAIRPR